MGIEQLIAIAVGVPCVIAIWLTHRCEMRLLDILEAEAQSRWDAKQADEEAECGVE